MDATREVFGCGRSYKWESQAIDIAREVGEDCSHLSVFTIDVIFSSKDVRKRGAICNVSCPSCDSPYIKTSAKLTKVFNSFYGIEC